MSPDADLGEVAEAWIGEGSQQRMTQVDAAQECVVRGTRFFDPDSRCAAVRGDGFSEIRLIADWLASVWGVAMSRVDATYPGVLDRLADAPAEQLVFVERLDAAEPRHLARLAGAIEARCTEHPERPVAFSYREAAPGSLVEGLVELSFMLRNT